MNFERILRKVLCISYKLGILQKNGAPFRVGIVTCCRRRFQVRSSSGASNPFARWFPWKHYDINSNILQHNKVSRETQQMQPWSMTVDVHGSTTMHALVLIPDLKSVHLG